MTHKRKSFRAFPAGIILPLFALFAFPAGPVWSQDAGKPVIGLTLSGEEISFRLAGSGGAVVDWGDGGRETITLKAGSVEDLENGTGYEVRHIFNEWREGVNVKIEGNLTALDCDNAYVAALDLSGNPALRGLHCGGTGITALDMSGNPGLEWLNCGDTGITSLDLSGNPAFKLLLCFHNKMNAAAAEAMFKSLPDRRGESEGGYIQCGGTTACGEELHALAREKNWAVNHR